MERALKRYQKELKEGEESALIAIANHVPFILLKSLSKNGTIKELANTFLNDMKQKKVTSEKENNINRQERSIEVKSIFHITDL